MNTEIDELCDMKSCDIKSCDIALKEWGVTCRALGEGRQIALLRKGGLLDEEGVFHLEHQRFWLQPTYLHQDLNLVKPEHHDLFQSVEAGRETGENREFIALRWLAEATEVLALNDENEDQLRRALHIWSSAYLDTRFNYKPEHPLLCVLLRVYALPQAVHLPMQPQWTGCRSWIELAQPLCATGAQAVLNKGEWEAQRTLWRELFPKR